MAGSNGGRDSCHSDVTDGRVHYKDIGNVVCVSKMVLGLVAE